MSSHDHWTVIEEATQEMPYRLVTAPVTRHYLNSSFTRNPDIRGVAKAALSANNSTRRTTKKLAVSAGDAQCRIG